MPDWVIAHGATDGLDAPGGMWSFSMHETRQDADRQIRTLLGYGCVVHDLRGPNDKLVLDRSAIEAHYGRPKSSAR